MRLLVDLMCGGIVSYLRMCGHDAAYAADRGLEADAALGRAARDENRVLLTRDRALAGRTDDAILLTRRDVEGQLAELSAAGVALELPPEPTRCGRCNGPLERVSELPAPETGGPVPEGAPDPRETPVWACQACGQWFWRGSHWDDVRETLSRIDSAGDQ